jgi:hypothetical protein
VDGYTTFSLSTQAGEKTQVIVLVENSLAVKANMKLIHDIMDPSIQSDWLHLDHHVIRSGGRTATLGAFTMGGVYREWTPDLNRAELSQTFEILLSQICKASENSAQVMVPGNFNVDLDRSGDRGYYMGAMLRSLSECTASAGLETHLTGPTWRSFGNFCQLPQGGDLPPSGDPLLPSGDPLSPAGDAQRPAGSSRSLAGDDGNIDCHKHSRLDHIYTKWFAAELVVLADSTTDHRPMVTTVKAGEDGEANLNKETKLQGFNENQHRDGLKPPQLDEGLQPQGG